MEKFYTKLEKTLKKDSRFIDQDGDLLKNNIIDAAYKGDKKLVEMLLSEKELKKKFFIEVENAVAFNINEFVSYIFDKNFLADSYTKYCNKIGLNIGGKFLNERKEVALVWPFKDCVLEGGMTKDDEKCKEMFFNEILAQNEIDKLLSPKVLTNWKRYAADGVTPFCHPESREAGEGSLRQSKQDKHYRSDSSPTARNDKKIISRNENGAIRENMIIKGNNLLALHCLKKQFQNKIKLIYIDPPYNTGNDSFGYNDNFNHSTWLTFMKNRLEAAKDLLRDDGVIFVQCDDNEQAYLKVLMDEVFGRDNFVNSIIWLNKEGGGKSDSKFFIKKEEYAHCFAKNIEFLNLNRRTLQEDSSYSFSDKYEAERGRYKLIKLNSFSIQYSKSLDYEIQLPNGDIALPSENGKRGCWRWSKNQFNWGLKNGFIEFKNNGDGKLWVYTKQYFKVDFKGNPIKRNLPFLTRIDEFSSTTGTKEQESLFGQKLFNYPKPEGYIKKIIEISTNPGDIVLDYHLGSGTTCAVAHKMGRQYIGIEQMDYIEKITVERLKKVINGEQGGISESVNWKGGGDFIYCELMKYNEKFIEKIKAAKNAGDLLKIWEEMKEKSFLNYNVDIKKFDDNIDNFKELPLVKQRRILFDFLNKNQLYINLSEIEDEEFGVGEGIREMNRGFYGNE